MLVRVWAIVMLPYAALSVFLDPAHPVPVPPAAVEFTQHDIGGELQMVPHRKRHVERDSTVEKEDGDAEARVAA
jgi:hypothetical protein